MKIFNFDTLINKVDHFVESYKNDLVIDRDCFINNTPFIHIARKTGSRMITRHEFDQVADRVINDPNGYSKVLFSQLHNSELLKTAFENALYTANYDCSQKTDFLIHYYNGSELVQFDDNKALNTIIRNWYKLAESKIEGFKR